MRGSLSPWGRPGCDQRERAALNKTDKAGHIAELERELAELRAAVPAHSMPPSMLMRIEELEDELREAQAASQESLQEVENPE